MSSMTVLVHRYIGLVAVLQDTTALRRKRQGGRRRSEEHFEKLL